MSVTFVNVTDSLSQSQNISNNVTGAGTNYTYQVMYGHRNNNKRISPKLYFSYVKSKLNKAQVKKLKSRILKLQAFVRNANNLGQTALYEEFSRLLLVAIKESEVVAAGYDCFVNRADVEKFMGRVTENSESTKNPVYFKKLEEFPRPIPKNVSKIIKNVQSNGLFDELWVLYLDYSNEKVKSTKEKIREKDPILFGKFAYDSERLYFITDWIDEHCDLTLTKFIDTLKSDNQEYDVSQVEDLTPEYLEQLKKEITDRTGRLASTNPNNFVNMMGEEDKAEIKRLKEENAKFMEERAQDRKEFKEDAAKQRVEMEESATKLDNKSWYRKLFW